MAKIDNSPNFPAGSWGTPGSIRERLLDVKQFDRKKTLKKGNPKNPPLASWDLLDFIGPAHSSDELRLPEPPFPAGHDADLQGFQDRPHLARLVQRGEDREARQLLDRGLAKVQATPDRRGRMEALLRGEEQMLALVQQVNDWVKFVTSKMQEEQKERA